MANHSLRGEPPELTINLPHESDLASELITLRPGYSVIDIQLLTVKDCEFSSCYHYLQNPSKYYHPDIGLVYIGKMGNGEENKKLVVGLNKCSMGSGVGGSTVTVENVVKFLRPKVVFCVGFCGGMNETKARLGDVVLATKLNMYAPSKITKGGIERRGHIVPMNKKLNDISHYAAVGWKPPLKDKKQKGNVIPGSLLSGPVLVNDRKERDRLLKAYPDAIAIEMEAEGVYTAAHDLGIEWAIVKGISDYADGTKDDTKSWQSYASVMAASVVANILSDPMIFEEWPHYGGSPVPDQERLFPISPSAQSYSGKRALKRPRLF